jgi:1,4-alpha-glucan branching enzyme
LKNTIVFITALVLCSIVQAQVVSDPTLPTADAPIEITLDVTGTSLEGYTGLIYAHTGVTVNSTPWQYIIGSWGDNVTQPAMTSMGNNLFTLDITPDVFAYYGVPTSEMPTALSFVFRSADGSLQTSPDIFVTLYENTMATVVITTPSDNDVFDLNETIVIEANATQAVDFEMKVNGAGIGNSSNTTVISEMYTFENTGDYTITVEGSIGGTVVSSDEIYVYVPITTQLENLPSGLINGLNRNVDGSLTFVITAPGKEDMMLLGDFNSWRFRESYQMKRDGEVFWLTLDQNLINLTLAEEYAYQYVADFELFIADPFAEKVLDPTNDQDIDPVNYPNLKAYPDAAFGIVSSFDMIPEIYEWQVNDFTRPDQENLVIYELLVRDFSEEDSFQAVIDRLDYLEALGVNAIEFMPLSEFEGNDSWGYNVSFHHALDKMYGTKNKLKELVDACHERGIAVILDVVFNHAFSQSSLCQLWWDPVNFRPSADNPYLNVAATHDFNVGYDFNHESTYTKAYVKQTLAYWVNEFRMDGFRFDLSKGFTQNNTLGDVGAWNMYDQSRVDILEDYASTIWTETSTDLYMILEHLSDNEEEKALANFGFLIWGKMTDAFNQNTMGYIQNNDVSSAYHENRDYNDPHLIAYMESHDEERIMFKNQEFGNIQGGHDAQDLGTALDRTEAANVIFYSIPGPKMLWQFGELGYDISIDENGRTGRKPIPWTLGYDTTTDRLDLNTLIATMIALKQEYPVFNTLDNVLNLDTPQKSIHLYSDTMDVVVLANFEMNQANMNPEFSETGSWFDFFTGEEITVTNTTAPINIQPGAYKMYTSEPLVNPLYVEDFSSSGLRLYPNPADTSFSLSSGVDSVTVYDLLGQIVLDTEVYMDAGAKIYVGELPQGVYLVKIGIGGATQIKRLLVR